MLMALKRYRLFPAYGTNANVPATNVKFQLLHENEFLVIRLIQVCIKSISLCISSIDKQFLFF